MLDIVSNFNEKHGFEQPSNGQSIEEVNCVSHYDPGLLSISILSKHEGLQLKDMNTNQWIDGPLESEIGVIWLGEAAARLTDNHLKPGIDRMIYPQGGKPRLTMCYEVCTIAQLENLSVEKKSEVMAGGSVTFDNRPGLGVHQLKLKNSAELSEKAVRTFISVGADWFEQLVPKELI
ncbi:unnamed protein product [Rotaria sp. Silwood2]|nr:unnamed protein product [Rotaria sp. Silwood2]CAF4227133.1 unnamed protein product [Rotaria sp. Silwood2]